ncbi:hypothetical protein [Capnocytophaga canis]|uniref:hypothetical protein n=1 Tax=Capnocytophaga canis TaxID=1848903 RepID=UPI003858E561
MAVQKEIWIQAIVEAFFADDSFVSKSYNADVFVNQGKSVHIPNAGAPSGVEKNRTTFPAQVNTRTDVDLKFDLDEFTTNPIRIPHADTVELSYDKRNSVLRQDKSALINRASEAILFSWLPANAHTIETSGKAVTAHSPSATGNRKAFTKEDVRKAMVKFNTQNVPQTGRYLLVDAEMYGQLLDSLTTQEAMAFHATANVQKGVLGQLYSFQILMRSRVGVYANNGAKKEFTAVGATTDVACALAWHEDSVCRAMGEVEMFDNISDPTYYGDIYSFLVRCGGRAMRNDVAGLLAIKQATA